MTVSQQWVSDRSPCAPCCSGAPRRRGPGASGCGTWDGTFLSCSYPHWSTLSEKPLEVAPSVPPCILSASPHSHMTTACSSRGRSPTWSWRPRTFWGLRRQTSCEDWRRKTMKDADWREMVPATSSDETERGLTDPSCEARSAGQVLDGATLRRRADRWAAEAPPSHCREAGVATWRRDTENQRRWPGCCWSCKYFLCPRAPTEPGRRSCSIPSCWFCSCASGRYFLYSLSLPVDHSVCPLNQQSHDLKEPISWSCYRSTLICTCNKHGAECWHKKCWKRCVRWTDVDVRIPQTWTALWMWMWSLVVTLSLSFMLMFTWKKRKIFLF